MDKRIASYILITRNTEWPKRIVQEFNRAYGKYGLFMFDDGSEDDLLFQAAIVKYNFRVDRKTMILCTGQALYRYPYHYLSIRDDRDYIKSEFMDKSAICSGDENTMCRQGMTQICKLRLNLRKTKKLDIMIGASWLKPIIIIVSPMLKKVFEDAKLTGCHFVPCLDECNTYSDEELDFTFSSDVLNATAPFYQLIVASNARQPKRLGKLRRIIQQCSSCGVVYRWDSEEYGYFHSEDLETVDFQRYDKFCGDDGLKFTGAPENVIISSRVLKLLHDVKARGLSRYLVDPPVKHGVVDIRS